MIAAVILTFNEEKHIRRCIDSIGPVVNRIYVVDSYSTDATLDILAEYDKVEVLQRRFTNYASQFNFALDEFEITESWVLRIDADEYLDDKLCEFLSADRLEAIPREVSGIYVNRLMVFLGRKLRFGSMSSYWMLRVWRNGLGRCETTWMDEHIVLSSGSTIHADGELVDHNLNNLSWWAHKHVDYSTREAIDVLLRERGEQDAQIKARLVGSSSERSRLMKTLYNRFPLFSRPLIYFLFRYFVRGGFLDGVPGFAWHVLQGFWYRTMVDAKVYEIRQASLNSGKDIKSMICELYGYEV